MHFKIEVEMVKNSLKNSWGLTSVAATWNVQLYLYGSLCIYLVLGSFHVCSVWWKDLCKANVTGLCLHCNCDQMDVTSLYDNVTQMRAYTMWNDSVTAQGDDPRPSFFMCKWTCFPQLPHMLGKVD